MKLSATLLGLPILFMLNNVGFAAHQLTSYDEIKQALLKGSTIKVVMDLKNDCTLDSHEGDLPYSPNTFGFNIETFGIKDQTGLIETSVNILNAPYGQHGASFENIEVQITKDNLVHNVAKAVSVQDSHVFNTVIDTCTIANKHSNGVKFYVTK